MTTSSLYTDKQKEELSRLFAGILYDGMSEPHPAKMETVAERFLVEARKLDWFHFEGNRYGVLRHLEEASVYGIYDFFPDKQSKLYLRTFSSSFQSYANKTGLPREKFINGFVNPKSGAKKPTPEMMRGDVSASGTKRMNMRRQFSGK